MKSFLIMNLLFLMAFSNGFGKNSVQQNNNGYNLASPDKTFFLPDQLREVSGLTIIDAETVALIQDEIGIIYIYDLRENRIKSQVLFAGKGDYEDIAIVNNIMYVLTSDGTIFEITDFRSNNFKVALYNTRVPSSDSEGLFFDKFNNRLLIGCKGDIKKDNFKNKRAIYAFDLKSKKLVQEPVYIFDKESVNKLIKNKKNGSKGEKDKKEKGKEIEIRTSAIGIHPKTGKLFILSASDNALFIVNKSGLVESIANLDNEIFPQAEGIAFFPNGDMLITNEAKNKKPTLLRFNYRSDF